VSWACSKIEGKESEDYLAAVIQEKLKNCLNASYTEIAKKAMILGKKKLAIKLMDFEPSVKRKVPVLLWMENFEEALKEAIKSRDPNLIYEVIFKMMKLGIDSKVVYNLVAKFTVAKPYLIFYLRNFEPEQLDEFYLHPSNTNEDKGLFFVAKAYQTKDLNKRLIIIRDAAFKNLVKEKWYDEVTKEQVELMNRMLTDSKVKVIEEKSLKQYMELYMKLDDNDSAEKLKKTFKVSDKSYLISKLKAYADLNKWPEFEALVAEKNKRSAVVPYYAIVEILVDYRQPELADKYIVKMPDVEDQLMTFKMMGKTKAYIDVAMGSKRYKLVEEMEGNPYLDPEIKKYIEDAFAKLNKKK